MKRGIRKYLVDFVSVVALMVVAIAIAAFILDQQRLRFPFVEAKPFQLEAELADANAVIPGQGQTVRVAGVKIGDIGAVELENGRAIVRLDIEQRFKTLVRKDASALLRTKTGLKDMFVEVDPGHGPPMQKGERIDISRTAPDVDLDEVLAVLDRDTRDYLRVLISGAGKGIEGQGGDLREALKRLGPLARDLARVDRATARRKANLRRLVNSYGLLMTELGRADRDVVRLVRSGNSVFESLASEEDNLEQTVRDLPGSLRSTQSALTNVNALGRELRPAARALRPAVRALDPAVSELSPLAREGTPILRNRIRPLVKVARPEVRDLGVGARRLAAAAPDLNTSVGKLNRLLNIISFNPGGSESLTGNEARDRARQEGYLYWFAWVAQSGTTLFGTSDAQGIFRRFTFVGTSCTVFTQIGVPPAVSTLLGAAGLCTGGGGP